MEPITVWVNEQGVLYFGDRPIGRLDDDVLILNLGWAKLAELGVRLVADPEVERPRNGIVFERLHG